MLARTYINEAHEGSINNQYRRYANINHRNSFSRHVYADAYCHHTWPKGVPCENSSNCCSWYVNILWYSTCQVQIKCTTSKNEICCAYRWYMALQDVVGLATEEPGSPAEFLRKGFKVNYASIHIWKSLRRTVSRKHTLPVCSVSVFSWFNIVVLTCVANDCRLRLGGRKMKWMKSATIGDTRTWYSHLQCGNINDRYLDIGTYKIAQM